MAEVGDKGLIKREIIARRELKQGTVVSQRRLQEFDQSTNGAPCWVVDVEIGSNNLLRDVPIKASGSGSRFYADRGQTVLLRRSTDGRYQVVAPGDRKAAEMSIKYYNLGTQGETSATSRGFTFEHKPWSYYYTPYGGVIRWNDGVTPLNKVAILDADGQEVV